MMIAMWKVIVQETERGYSSINFRILQLQITVLNKMRHTGSLLGKGITE
jgi:hypothetical protein